MNFREPHILKQIRSNLKAYSLILTTDDEGEIVVLIENAPFNPKVE
jgi:hypothetical protein